MEAASPWLRFAGVVRDVARGGLSAILAAFVVGGLGGRLVMMVAARLNPGAAGLITGAGETVGVFTVNGTVALMFFGALGLGIVAGVAWVVVSPWIPASGPRRWLLAMPVAVALTGFLLVEPGNRDFVILGPDGVIVALLLGLVALVGGSTAWLDERLDRKLPVVRADRRGPLIAYGVVAGLGLLLLPEALAFYLPSGPGAAVSRTGAALLVAGAATCIWWASRVATGRMDPPHAALIAGRIGLVAAVLLGSVHLGGVVARIVAAG